MSYEPIDVHTAHERQSVGWIYVDVRSPEEFMQGHPEGSVNIPIMLQTPGGMTPNPKFLDAMTRKYKPTDKLLLGCRSGARSARAAEMLATRGFSTLANVSGGFSGNAADQGWAPAGLPTRSTPAPETTWAEIERSG